jgi:transcription elongation factor S-II
MEKVISIKDSNKLEEIIKMKNVLETKEDSDTLSSVLNKLLDTEVGYDDISNSKIGKTLKKLTKHKNQDISKLSDKVIDKWKKMVKKNTDGVKEKVEKVSTESNSTPKTQTSQTSSNSSSNKKKFSESYKKICESLSELKDGIRNNVRKMLFDALINNEELEHVKLVYLKEIVLEIEKKMHELLLSKPDDKPKYLNRAKAIVSNLHDKKNQQFRDSIINNELTAVQLITMDVKEMANSEINAQRKLAEEESFKSRRSDWNKINTKASEGMYMCEECHGEKTTSFQMQIRGADEPMTLFITCVDCGHEWKLG